MKCKKSGSYGLVMQRVHKKSTVFRRKPVSSFHCRCMGVTQQYSPNMFISAKNDQKKLKFGVQSHNLFTAAIFLSSFYLSQWLSTTWKQKPVLLISRSPMQSVRMIPSHP